MKILNYCRGFPKQSFDPGECILSEGTQKGVIYILLEGSVEVTKEGMIVANVSEPGAIFGEVSALLKTPHMASVKALEQCRCFVVPDPQAFIRSHPEVGLILSTLLAQRLSSVTNNLTSVKRSVDALIKQQTSKAVKAARPTLESPSFGVVSVGPFQRGNGTLQNAHS